MTSATELAPPTLRPWQASIQARLTRAAGSDQVDVVDFEHSGIFVRGTRIVGSGIGSDHMVVLGLAERAELLAELQSELQHPPAGTDIVGVQVFVDLLQDSINPAPPPSTRFDGARFGGITYDETRNILYGHLGLGVDVSGTVRDAKQLITFEQHPVMLPPGSYRPLSPADQASLAAAIAKYVATTAAQNADLWKRMLADL
jgi:hypothetical protein